MGKLSAPSLSVLFIFILCGCGSVGFTSVTYRGETIPLSRTYADFDEYRDDPNNLPRDVLPKVVRLAREAPVSRTYPTREAAQDALYQLMFPGYGYSVLALDQPVALYALEIPGAAQDRFLAYAPTNGEWVLIDDFIWPASSASIRSAEVGGDQVRYYDEKGALVRVH